MLELRIDCLLHAWNIFILGKVKVSSSFLCFNLRRRLFFAINPSISIQVWILWRMLKKIWKCKCMEVLYGSFWLSSSYCPYWESGLFSHQRYYIIYFYIYVSDIAIVYYWLNWVGFLLTRRPFSLIGYIRQHPSPWSYSRGIFFME